MTRNKQIRILVVSFDGLRPDLITSSTTPNIRRLQQLGTTLAKHRTVFPTETRAAFPSFVTGATVSRHGMVGSSYLDRSSIPHRFIDTGDSNLLDQLNAESGGRLMTAETLGEVLARRGKTLAVLSSNSAGTARLFHHKAEACGHIRISGNFIEACTPREVLKEVVARLDQLPPREPHGVPNLAVQEFLTSAFLEIVWPKRKPDITVLSFGEPDDTSHYQGVAAPPTMEALAFCDKQFGRLLDWWEAEGRDEDVQFAVISDHGHITGHTRISIAADLKKAGYRIGPIPGPDVDVIMGQVGALYLTQPTSTNIAKLAEVLTNQEWCGPIFTAAKNDADVAAPGTLSSDLIMARHERAPDIYVCFRTDDGVDQFGLVGRTYCDSRRGAGLGEHGGLHPNELAAVGILAGSAFPNDGFASPIPSGICDFAPTFLKLLGIPVPGSATGRVLEETLSRESRIHQPQVEKPEVFVSEAAGYAQILKRIRVDDTIYLEGGWAGPSLSSVSPNC